MGKSLLLAAALAVLAAGQVGCRACGSPFDYSSPLATGGCETCDSCNSGSTYYAEGTIVSGH